MPEHNETMGPLVPGTDKHVRMRPMAGGAIRLRGGFWARRQLLNREVTIPHGMDMLEETGNLDNLRLAADLIKGEHHDPFFAIPTSTRSLRPSPGSVSTGRTPTRTASSPPRRSWSPPPKRLMAISTPTFRCASPPTGSGTPP